ncbi:MAG: sulfate ABC transporter permease [Acidobacteria bacterium RIFCSPLOWO2_02_FULL_61_28]|nr:MAG: sulfate ABC transporter permease [Acidobacteria bacterium RIFCSPLOWO2_02_FULL_61_28]
MKKAARQLLFYLFLLLVWQLLFQRKLWPPYLFPSPTMVGEALWQGFSDRTFLVGVTISMRRIALGYGFAVVLGVVLGFLIAASDFLEATVGGLVLSLQSLPSICWLPLAILWFGLSERAILFVVVMGSLLSVTINTEVGVRHVPKLYRMAGRNLGARGFGVFAHVLFPASLPHLVVGLKQGWAFAWRSLISGEMIFVSLGLGHLLMVGRDLNDMSQVIAVMIVIMALGQLVDQLIFRGVESRIRNRWGLAREV